MKVYSELVLYLQMFLTPEFSCISTEFILEVSHASMDIGYLIKGSGLSRVASWAPCCLQ